MLVRNLLDRTDDTGVLITHLTRALIRQSMEPLNIRVGGTMVVITAAPLVGDTMEAITAATLLYVDRSRRRYRGGGHHGGHHSSDSGGGTPWRRFRWRASWRR